MSTKSRYKTSFDHTHNNLKHWWICVTSVIETYQWYLNSRPYVPSMTSMHTIRGTNGVANQLFIPFLFNDPDVGVQFLKDVGLIWSSTVCCKCGSQTSRCFDTDRRDGNWWWCGRITSGSSCSDSTSIRHSSWFQQNNLNCWKYLPH